MVSTKRTRLTASPMVARKRQQTSLSRCSDLTANDTQTETVDASNVDLTARNSIASPLLRLPAELRIKIWQYAYGDKRVSIADDVTPKGSLQYHFISTGSKIETTTSLRIMPLVCKQFWHEALQVVFSTCTFSFHDAQHFKMFIESDDHQVTKRNLQNLQLREVQPLNFRRWAEMGILERGAIHQFKNLKGLTVCILAWIATLEYFGPNSNVMQDDCWKKSGILELVKAFQHRPLIQAKTVVEFEGGYEMSEEPGTNMVSVAQQIRGQLLKYKYLRRSARERNTTGRKPVYTWDEW